MANSLYSSIAPAFHSESFSFEDRPWSITGQGDLESWFDVTELAVASIGMAGHMLADLMQADLGGAESSERPIITIDRRLASFWFGMTLKPIGWQMPSVWDPIAGDYQSKDGWIRLHTNAPAHRKAALSVLGETSEREEVARRVGRWEADTLESAIIEAGGCAAKMRSLSDWNAHGQGRAVAQDPLVIWKEHGTVDGPRMATNPDRPLTNLKVLDLTRVLAGPVAGRFLAAFGAEVLRIDPPSWDEPGVVPEVTLGKRCAGLDLKDPDDREHFEDLLRDADVLLHGYRPAALVNLGYDADTLRTLNPRLIDVCLNAYGWSGPWADRRGFDSLVQMSSGIADYGMRQSGADRPVPLPVQALDHATGYLLAAAVLQALSRRQVTGAILSAKLSLARVAHCLAATKRQNKTVGLTAEADDDLGAEIERTVWGEARRTRFPMQIGTIDARWPYPAGPLRSSPAQWSSDGL